VVIHPYKAELYYASNVKWPKRPGELAIAVENGSSDGLMMDVEAGKRRNDIGVINWRGPDGFGGSWERH
jgi:hypothetical protein